MITVLVTRLVGGLDNATGRVEVYYNGTWGTVCNDGWDIYDARVVCRQLGFRYALNAYERHHYGRGTGPILLDELHCSGSESSLLSCIHQGVGEHNCDHSEDAGVRCGNTGGEEKKDECVFNVSNINDWLIIKILVDYYKIVIGSFIPLLTSVTAYPFLQTFLPGICAANIACLLYFDYNFSRSTCWWP